MKIFIETLLLTAHAYGFSFFLRKPKFFPARIFSLKTRSKQSCVEKIAIKSL